MWLNCEIEMWIDQSIIDENYRKIHMKFINALRKHIFNQNLGIFFSLLQNNFHYLTAVDVDVMTITEILLRIVSESHLVDV